MKLVSNSELKIITFANFVEANNFHGAKEAFKGAAKEDEIMMKAILIKASTNSSMSPGMREFVDSVIGN